MEIMVAAATCSCEVLLFAPEWLFNDLDFINTASMPWGSPRGLDLPSQSHQTVWLAAISCNHSAFRNGPRSLQNDQKFLEAACEKTPLCLQFAPRRHRCNKDSVLAAVRRDGSALVYASMDLRNNEEVVLVAVSASVSKWVPGFPALEYASSRLQNREDIVLTALSKCGAALRYASKRLKNNEKMVLDTLGEDSTALEHASPDLQCDRDFVLKAVREYGASLRCVREYLKGDKEVVLTAAVSSSGEALRYASKRLLNGRGFWLEAVECSGAALEFAPLRFQDDIAVVCAAAASCSKALQWVSPRLCGNMRFRLAIARQRRHFRRSTSHSLKIR